MSVPANRRSTDKSKSSRVVEIQALSDISIHRVWWRSRWVLWFDEPFSFEKQRPWSHRPLPRQAFILLFSSAIALWTLMINLGSLGLMISAIATSAIATTLGAAITWAEVRFWAWWTKNDNRAALDAFRRPERLHMAVTTSESALQALADAGDPAALAEEFALEHARGLAGWRTYGTSGWVRLSDIADTKPLLELHSATTQWRALNESWTDEAEWEANFTGTAPALPPEFRRRRLLERFRSGAEDPVDETSTRLRSAARTARRSLENAASRGLEQTRKLSSKKSAGGLHTRSVIPMIAIAPTLAVVAVLGLTLAATPDLAERFFPQAPIAAPDERASTPEDTSQSKQERAPSEDVKAPPFGEGLDEWLDLLGMQDGTDESPVDGVVPAPDGPDLIALVYNIVVPALGLTLIFAAGMVTLTWIRRGW